MSAAPYEPLEPMNMNPDTPLPPLSQNKSRSSSRKQRNQSQQQSPPTPQFQIKCRVDAQTTGALVPLSIVQHYAEIGEDLPLLFSFDANGPFLCFAAGKGQQQYVSGIPLDASEIQKDIYFFGQRYWRKWGLEEKAITDAEESEAQQKQKKKNLGIIFISIGATLVVISLILVGWYAWRKSQSTNTQAAMSGLQPLPGNTMMVPQIPQIPAPVLQTQSQSSYQPAYQPAAFQPQFPKPRVDSTEYTRV